MRIRIYTTDREQPIDLTVKEIHTRMHEIRTNGEASQASERAGVDQTVRAMIKDPINGEAPNMLFSTDDGTEGAIYLNPEKVAAVVTSWETSSSITGSLDIP